jgi:hypothetical protein
MNSKGSLPQSPSFSEDSKEVENIGIDEEEIRQPQQVRNESDNAVRMGRSLSQHSSEEEEQTDSEITSNCFYCNADEASYRTVPCGCAILCKKCAMKMATGGICKVCRRLYTSMKQIPR